ncbi:rhomboid-like protein [Streptomyces huasconensis]|uniref:rhomboid-like protein n=1 Tax=Streptomyces huasconensis TaxID=1854574 RepID=UPI00370012A9
MAGSATVGPVPAVAAVGGSAAAAGPAPAATATIGPAPAATAVTASAAAESAPAATAVAGPAVTAKAVVAPAAAANGAAASAPAFPAIARPAGTATAGADSAVTAAPAARSRVRPWRLLPGPRRTPFTFGYAVVLTGTSLFGRYADPELVDALLRGSSTDVAHLAHNPLLVLVASALWIAGGITSPYAIAFLLVLTALERRIGGLRTAGVFLLGHVVATLATEVPVGLSVLAGHLPGSSLHRLDYGISFGVAASVGALAGLLTPWLRWVVLAGFGWMLVEDLIAFTDPMTNWGHLLAFAVGVCVWPLLRRGRPFRAPARPASRAAAG